MHFQDEGEGVFAGLSLTSLTLDSDFNFSSRLKRTNFDADAT